MDVKKSICIEMLFAEVPFKDRFRLARESGFEYIEFWSWKDKDIQMIKELCKIDDLKIASFSGDQELSMIDERQKQNYIAFVNESIETAKFLKCPHLVIHSNALDENGFVKNHYDNIRNSKKNAAMFDVLSDLAPAAKKANITLILEALNTAVDHAGYYLTSTREAVELIRSVNSSHIKVLYDLYHMQIMEGNIISSLKKYIDAIGYIHIADVPGRHEPGTGEINFAEVMNTLKELKYDGVIGFELTPIKDSKKAIDRIKNL
jgi:hydroxypyruvate isomerase